MNPPYFCGSWGIRTPGTINSHGSLANCWFQPLTQTSIPNYCIGSILAQMRLQRYEFIFIYANFLAYIFTITKKKIIFISYLANSNKLFFYDKTSQTWNFLNWHYIVVKYIIFIKCTLLSQP